MDQRAKKYRADYKQSREKAEVGRQAQQCIVGPSIE